MKISEKSAYHAISSLTAKTIVNQRVKSGDLKKTIKIVRNSHIKLYNSAKKNEAREFVKHIREILYTQNSKALRRKTELLKDLETLTMRTPAEKSADYTSCLIGMKFKREYSWSALQARGQKNYVYHHNTIHSKCARPEQPVKALSKPAIETLPANDSAVNKRCMREDDHAKSIFYDKDIKLTRERLNPTPNDTSEHGPKMSPLDFIYPAPPIPRAPVESMPAALKSTTRWD
ncbi:MULTISPECIES: hypothetical protein [unclassified Pseudomonas]|uniref:hypothetical protein n=1 Tax=unclassified Pseudomonas TaxID=196821 RepID=UPI000F56B9C0|nr:MULTISPECIES: hypothetical protein [unclassified Pseudomonas]AZF10383.1 hypothetical protein C4J93_2185 [Pseudomonas sp. R2-37-08W]AZF15609.1 hypothetical protein C4J92_2125 [Pseudomonas sp. R3-18-08]